MKTKVKDSAKKMRKATQHKVETNAVWNLEIKQSHDGHHDRHVIDCLVSNPVGMHPDRETKQSHKANSEKNVRYNKKTQKINKKTLTVLGKMTK